MKKKKKDVAYEPKSTTLEVTPPGSSPEQGESENEDSGGAGVLTCQAFIGLDAAARKAGLAVVLRISNGTVAIGTVPLDTQGVDFYAYLFRVVTDLAKYNVTDIFVTYEAPPPGRFAHKIGRSVNFAAGKIIGALGAYLLAARLPCPVAAMHCMPNQWRKRLALECGKKYTKDIAKQYVESTFGQDSAEGKTDDELEAICIAIYGVMETFGFVSFTEGSVANVE